MSGWRTNGPTKITRYTEHELDAAVADLEKRGYVLVSKTCDSLVMPQFQYKDSSKQKNFYKGTQQVKKWIAIMKKGG